ncbi:hypothetical protein GW17_00002886 [Ensete ventricosum]|nr:hypothetical protein GW17_00002886 [Ensete ventricosum]
MDDYRQRRTWHVRAVAVHESCWSTASDGVGKLGGVLSGMTRDHTAAGHEPHVTCPSMVLDHGTRKSPLDDQNTSEPSRLLISSPSSKDKTTSKGMEPKHTRIKLKLGNPNANLRIKPLKIWL